MLTHVQSKIALLILTLVAYVSLLSELAGYCWWMTRYTRSRCRSSSCVWWDAVRQDLRSVAGNHTKHGQSCWRSVCQDKKVIVAVRAWFIENMQLGQLFTATFCFFDSLCCVFLRNVLVRFAPCCVNHSSFLSRQLSCLWGQVVKYDCWCYCPYQNTHCHK